MSEQKTEFDKWFDDYEHNNDIRLAINYGAYDIAGDAWQAATAEANKRIAELTQDRNDLNYLCMERLHKIEALEGTVTRLRARLIAEKELLYDQIKIDMKTSRENEQLKVKNSELESEVANLQLNIKAQEQLGYELQASNHDLREALERFVSDAVNVDLGGGDSIATTCESLEIAHEALSATPAEPLQAFENSVIEKIINIIKSETDKFNNVDSLLYIIEILDNMKVNHETTKTP